MRLKNIVCETEDKNKNWGTNIEKEDSVENEDQEMLEEDEIKMEIDMEKDEESPRQMIKI